jgi:hypothetical protein
MKETCAAHGGMEKNIDRLRDETGQIFDLMRKMSDETGESNVRIATLEIQQKTGFESLTDRQSSFEKVMESRFSELLMEVKKRPAPKRWGPAHTATVAVALITAAATVITACFGGAKP